MMCKHPLIDKYVCYYCGERLARSEPGPQMAPTNRVLIGLGVEHLAQLKLAKEALVDKYAELTKDRDNMVKEVRMDITNQYREAMSTLNALIEQIKNHKTTT